MQHSTPLFVTDELWRQVFWSSFIAWWLMEMWILSRDRRAATGKAKDGGSRFALMVFIPLGMAGAFFAANRLPVARISVAPEAVFWLGIALIWGGMAFRGWAVVTLGRFFRTSVFMLEDHRLITTGPYRWLRNPSYTGSVVTGLGIGLSMGNWLSLLLAPAGILIGFAVRIAVEDRALRERFGQEYADYAKRSWALIPLIW
jgi:protein-S-isoprenylcysteine O-methyltransferase